jgi:hypothetical protein
MYIEPRGKCLQKQEQVLRKPLKCSVTLHWYLSAAW